MKIFEIVMLICFGVAWPVSIHKSYKSKTTRGRSLFFLYLVLIVYFSGIIHKVLNNFDYVTIFYAINAVMVTIEIIIFHRNRAVQADNASIN